ncbi:MAG: hypothetical protein ABR548_11975 [Actinomycetota bacterium]|nr:hypothetical protein [Actinomycetota bacterium]
MDEAISGEVFVCRGCGDAIDSCEFCDGEDCPNAICYGCVIIDIGQEIPEPHTHGG